MQVGGVERDVVEGIQGSVASVEEDQEKDMDIFHKDYATAQLHS